MSKKCCICNEEIDEAGADTSKVSEKGILTLIKSSQQRNDDKASCMRGLKSIIVHTSCRKNYTRTDTIAADLKRSASVLKATETLNLRSALPEFDFKNNCFLCKNRIENEAKKPCDKRRLIYQVRTFSIQQSCMEAGLARNDKWGEEVVGRLSSINDLVAEEAVYHNDCRLKFMKPLYKQPNISTDDYITEGMEDVYTYMEKNNDCQFSLDELMAAVTGEKFDIRTLKAKICQKYGNRVIIKPGTNRFDVPVICFRDTGYKLLNDAWYENKEKNSTEERLRIVQKAAEIIRQDIQSEVYDIQTYPPGDNFLKDANSVPSSLLTFLEDVMMEKTNKVEATKRKCIAFAHAIISVVRPRTFLSSVLSSLSLFLYRRYASKNLINLIASLGFCSSYYEAQTLEMSAMHHAQPSFKTGSFSQFVFDNADFNVCTIDGLNTFHAMGGIRCITPSNAIEKSSASPRLIKMPSSTENGKLGVVSLETLQLKRDGLKNVIAEKIEVPEESANPQPHDTLWLFAKKQLIPVPEWKGYMHCITRGNYSEKTKIVTLPFINAPPSNYDTVYTALRYAAAICDANKQQCSIVTFDQPLYWKAREIVAAASPDSPLIRCIVRLGGFHILMSFLGCIGYLMSGSGLKELLSTVYASLSVDKMLQGHAFARAVRGHLLTQTALSNIIFDQIKITEVEFKNVKELLHDFLNEPPTLHSLGENPHLKSLTNKLGEALKQLMKNGRTAKLWIQYFTMVNLMKDFIHSERSGNWDAHLSCIKRMIPYFHASGHFPYAKSCHLYLQDMIQLPSKMAPEVYNKFVNAGYFTIRRSDLFWSGVWSDMTIETTLMRDFKSRSGLTHGRGITESVLSKWIMGMSATNDICSSLEEFCGTFFTSSEQHEDFREASKTKNAIDIAKMTAWFENHPPFPEISDIMSIATGVIGDHTINCYDAVTVGKQAMVKMAQVPFSDIKLSRKDRALPISSMGSSIKIRDEKISVDPLLLFQRISICKKTDLDLKNYLKYELAPFPLALFDEVGMRKNRKSVLYTIFNPTDKNIDLSNFDIVIDGGFLIHKVIWQIGSSVSNICEEYLKFLKRHYSGKSCIVVFDGYAHSSNCTKAAELRRRYRMKKSVNINLNLNTKITVKQNDFLSNPHNKSELINLLKSKFQENGIETLQASGDADVLIVSTAINKSVTTAVAVIGEDIDLAVLLMAKTPSDQDIVFIKPGRGKICSSMYSTKHMQQLGLKDILFLHAFTGCDTTSAAFRKSKVGFIKLYQKHLDIREAAEVFSCSLSSQAEVWEAGQKCFLRWYGAPAKEISLDLYRYQLFVKSIANIKLNISSLPPTEGAAMEHSFRTYHQVQFWLGNELQSELWGWERKQDNELVPVLSKNLAAPEEILKMVFCRCTKDCSSSKCGCRKALLHCSSLCQNCQGKCLNSVPMLDSEDEEVESTEFHSISFQGTEGNFKQIADEKEINASLEPIAGPSHPKRVKTNVYD